MCMTPILSNGKMIPCNKCPHCRSLRQNSWYVRLFHESQNYPPHTALMLDLTYDNEHLPRNGGLNRQHCKNFFKKLRENLKKKYHFRIDIKYFLAGEYGGEFGRPHYHVILFGIPDYNTKETWQLIRKSWGKGNVDRKYVCHRSFRYVTKYCVKESAIQVNSKHFGIHNYFVTYKNGRKVHKFNWYNPNTRSFIENNFVLCSQHLGEKFLTKEKIYAYGFTHKSTVHVNGRDYSLPRSYIMKIRQTFPSFLRSQITVVYPDGFTRMEGLELFCQKLLKKDLDYATFELEDVSEFLKRIVPEYWIYSCELVRKFQPVFSSYKRPSQKYMFKSLYKILSDFFVSHTEEFKNTFNFFTVSEFYSSKRNLFDSFHNQCIKNGIDERKAYFGHKFHGSSREYQTYLDDNCSYYNGSIITNFYGYK